MDRKKALTLAIRLALSVGLIVFLFWQIPEFDTDELLPDLNRSTWIWLALAFGLTLAAMVMSVVRWREVAAVVGITDVRFRRFASHYFAGQFLSNFVPTTVGGDVLRVTRLSRDSDDTPGSFASVVFERLSGWLVLPAISLLGFALNPGLRTTGRSTLALYTALVVLAALVLLILIAGNGRIGRMLERREGLFEWINAIHLGVDSLRAEPRQVWRVLGSSFAYQAVLFVAAFCAVQALNIEEVGITALMAFFPAVLIYQVLPLGIGGLGVREGAFVLYFSGLGVVDERSIALGFLLYLLTIASSLVGLPALIFGGRNQDPDDAGDPDGTAATAVARGGHAPPGPDLPNEQLG